MSIRIKLIIIILFVALVPLAVSSLSALRIHQKALENSIRKLHQRTAKHGASLAQSYFLNLKKSHINLAYPPREFFFISILVSILICQCSRCEVFLTYDKSERDPWNLFLSIPQYFLLSGHKKYTPTCVGSSSNPAVASLGLYLWFVYLRGSNAL